VRREIDAFKQQLHDERQADADAEIDRKIAQLQQRQQRREQRKMEKQAPEPGVKTVKEQPLQAGDKVRIKGQDTPGEVVKINAGTVVIGVGNILISVPGGDLERISGNEFRSLQKTRQAMPPNAGYNAAQRKLAFRPALDVRGQRVEEALDSVAPFIDEALMVGAGEVKILHGKGSGILKEEIRKLLRTFGGIASVADEQPDRGGAGITVVQL
jgi:DNA mismatch repair protein MutS2